MAYIANDHVKKLFREAQMIRNAKDRPPCPDPTDGGCIGHHCIQCAAGEIMAVARIVAKDNDIELEE